MGYSILNGFLLFSTLLSMAALTKLIRWLIDKFIPSWWNLLLVIFIGILCFSVPFFAIHISLKYKPVGKNISQEIFCDEVQSNDE